CLRRIVSNGRGGSQAIKIALGAEQSAFSIRPLGWSSYAFTWRPSMVRKPFTTGDTEVHEGMPQRVLVSGLWDLAAGAECCPSNELWSFAPLDSRGRVPLRVRLSGQTRGVIGQAQEQQEQEPRHRGNQDGFGHLLAGVFHVHEDEGNQRRFEGRDSERN